MGFIYEKVKEEDWELYNSFLPNYETADRFTRWVADKERNIYFFWIGGETREEENVYFLAWDDLKIFIYTKVRIYEETDNVDKAHIWINRILMPKAIKKDKKNINDTVEFIKEMLQIIYENQVFFEEISEVTFREDKY